MPVGVVGPLLSPSNQGASFDLTEIEKKIDQVNGRALESAATEGDSPVCKNPNKFKWHPSNTEHVEPRVNLCRPLHKAKHNLSPIVHPVP